MMKRKLNAAEEATRQRLRQRLLLILDFVESVQEFPSGKSVRALVEESTARGDLRGLKLLAREMDMALIGLEPHERDGLEALLQARLGVDVDAERAKLAKQASAALRRGKISSEKERRRLEDYAERLEASDPSSSEAIAVRSLLRNG